MERSNRTVTLILAIAIAAFAPSALFAQVPSETISTRQLQSLIANAKTPTQHQRIAAWYEAQAQKLAAESREHATLAEHYRQNPLTASAKFATGTVNHCEYISHSLAQQSTKFQQLARLHQGMAKDAERN